MKNKDSDVVLIVALGKMFNNTRLNPSECNIVCDMSISDLVDELGVNHDQAYSLIKWAKACKVEEKNEEDNC